jgi:hypothetical protein
MSNLIEVVKLKMNKDKRFYFVDRGTAMPMWTTTNLSPVTNKPGTFIDLNKMIAGKGYGEVELIIFGENEQGLEFRVRMLIPSYNDWYTFFEGFAETEADFDRVMIMLGIK